MTRDYEAEGKELLFRALEAMVNNIETCGGAVLCNYCGEDIVKVYKAIIIDSKENSEIAERAIKDGISDGLLKAIMNA